MDRVTVIAPAKINLSLDITGVDEKGYHLLDMIMQSVSIFERVTLTKQDSGITMGSNARYIPTDSKNTAVMAAINFFDYAKIDGGVHIYIKKTVPIKAGMAGGSADAAGVIVGLNKLYNTRFTMEQLCEIGAMTGSDVPFMLVGGTKRVQGVGNIILPCADMPRCHFVICMPSKGVSTPQAFANYDKLGYKTKVETDKLVQAIENEDLTAIAKYMANDLEKAAGSEDTEPIKKQLIEQGALGSVMTGSGAAVFGIFDSEEKAKRAFQYFKGRVRSVFLAKPVDFGASITMDRGKYNKRR
ncbi:MAG: 4-(cytidine 5'-diphospho)-2-C-methyl-D-erythritol kinase [Oscillospiraceae bacterium]|nr:4-(cytidine 5'-diphospho)-2-C-methyl-D-erythritol kinase [Oscillospiraceae bacterium]